MSSWRKAAKSCQKVHRERSQPSERSSKGLLEKKKDYRQRAKHHHDNRDTLKLLQRRALDKNPDEFYHHMINSKVRNGVHHEVEQEDEHTEEQIRLMQTQDIKYINMMRTQEANRIERMQSTLHMIDDRAARNTHTLFVDEPEEARRADAEYVARRLGTHPALLDNRANRLRIDDLAALRLPDARDDLAKERGKSYKTLAKSIQREKELSVVQQKMEIKRSLLDKKVQKPTRIKAATAVSAPVYKWKYERKR